MRVFDFDRALVRTPAPSVVRGLRDIDVGAPDFAALMAEHYAYTAALRQAGLQVSVLDPLDAYPDAVFVEDPALVFGDTAILLAPGAPSRAGEVAEIAPALAPHFAQIIRIEQGFVDGGDILVTPAAVLIGLSARTDARGAASLVSALATIGRRGRVVAPPAGVLHLKTGANLIDENVLLVTAAMAVSGLFRGFELVQVPESEAAAANALRLNDRLLIGAHFVRTIDILARRGFDLVPLHVAEIGKLDAGLSCMSLRWKTV